MWFLLATLGLSITDLDTDLATPNRSPTSPVAANGTIRARYGHGSHSVSSKTDGPWSALPSINLDSRHVSVDLDLDKVEGAALYLLTRIGSATGSVTFEKGSSAKATVRITVDYAPRIYGFLKVWQVRVLERGTEHGVWYLLRRLRALQ